MIVAPGGQRDDGLGELGFGPAFGHRVDPLHDVAVAVGLQRREVERLGVGGQPDRHVELLEVSRCDPLAVGRGPRDRVDGLVERLALVGRDRRLELGLAHVDLPTRNRFDRRVGDRMILRERHFDLRRARIVLLVRDLEGERREAAGRRFGRCHADVRVRRRGQEQHDPGQQATEHDPTRHRDAPPLARCDGAHLCTRPTYRRIPRGGARVCCAQGTRRRVRRSGRGRSGRAPASGTRPAVTPRRNRCS